MSEELPPPDAPLKEKLAAAMRRAGYSNKRLAKELGTDRSHVGRWLSGRTQRITAAHHLRRLPDLLGTPPDYFVTIPRTVPSDRLAKLEARVAELEQAADEASRERLEGSDELAGSSDEQVEIVQRVAELEEELRRLRAQIEREQPRLLGR